MLIEALVAILRDVVLAVLWLGALVLALGLGSSVAVLGLGHAFRVRLARPHPAPATPAPLVPPDGASRMGPGAFVLAAAQDPGEQGEA